MEGNLFEMVRACAMKVNKHANYEK